MKGVCGGRNFWLGLARASAQCLRLSERFFHYFYFIAHVVFVLDNLDDDYVDNHHNFRTLSMTFEYEITALLWY